MNENLEYIRNKKLIEIFEGLLGYIYFKKPKNIIMSIIDELKKLEKEKKIKNVFNKKDIETVYTFINLENNKYITKDKCILGLNQFLLNNKQREYMEKTEIKDNVDLEIFTSYAEEIINV
ncbi:conserved Plasmodium protein, unknown function [Plasmodium relictum]|uniref:Uncharacterized protein n=1 Tax=Plasmodium relictum TaxID=85471 RepID=A0A1J1HCX9_PLARL|nr:conserved Plasmodium protein, unknown function [Plasmodium relictum]CRH01276.1 conserved Plasmodium protein, unknown function [Plasmodium relictum]